MTPARLSFYSTIIILFCSLFWLVLTRVIARLFFSPMADDAADAAILLTLLLAFISSCFLIAVLLRRSAAKNRIRLIDQDKKSHRISAGHTLGFVFGAFWRLILIGIITQAGAALLRRAYGDDLGPVQNMGIDLASFAVTWFAAFYWVFAAPFGNYRILYDPGKFPIQSPRAEPEPPAQSSLAASVSSLREVITGTLGVIFAISYFGIGLLQIGAVVSFFRDVLGWWLIPSLLLASVVGYLPVIGSLAGSYAAVTIWGWAWYIAVAVFFFPVIIWVAIMLIAGASAATQALFGEFTRRAAR
jgi:hypothetical protein